jgi:hypothetical protein
MTYRNPNIESLHTMASSRFQVVYRMACVCGKRFESWDLQVVRGKLNTHCAKGLQLTFPWFDAEKV